MRGLDPSVRKRTPDSSMFIASSSRRQLIRRRSPRHVALRTPTLSNPLPGVASRRGPVWFQFLLTVILLTLAVSLVSGHLIV
jgi:hypothetical protein